MEPEPGPGRWDAAVCVLTGASRGFGRSLARLLARRLGSGSVLLLLARSAAPLAELAAELRGGGTGLRVEYVAADLGCQEGLRRATAALGEVLAVVPPGRLLLVNNAGNNGPPPPPPPHSASPGQRGSAPASPPWVPPRDGAEASIGALGVRKEPKRVNNRGSSRAFTLSGSYYFIKIMSLGSRPGTAGLCCSGGFTRYSWCRTGWSPPCTLPPRCSPSTNLQENF